MHPAASYWSFSVVSITFSVIGGDFVVSLDFFPVFECLIVEGVSHWSFYVVLAFFFFLPRNSVSLPLEVSMEWHWPNPPIKVTRLLPSSCSPVSVSLFPVLEDFVSNSKISKTLNWMGFSFFSFKWLCLTHRSYKFSGVRYLDPHSGNWKRLLISNASWCVIHLIWTLITFRYLCQLAVTQAESLIRGVDIGTTSVIRFKLWDHLIQSSTHKCSSCVDVEKILDLGTRTSLSPWTSCRMVVLFWFGCAWYVIKSDEFDFKFHTQPKEENQNQKKRTSLTPKKNLHSKTSLDDWFILSPTWISSPW